MKNYRMMVRLVIETWYWTDEVNIETKLNKRRHEYGYKVVNKKVMNIKTNTLLRKISVSFLIIYVTFLQIRSYRLPFNNAS